MRIHNILRNTRGFAKAADSALKWQTMKNKQEVERRVKILTFWQKHGTNTTKDAFGVSRPTLFRWQKELNDSNGNIQALDPKSTAPKKRRVRQISPPLEQAIINWRTKRPRIGGKKLVPLLKKEGFKVSVSYVNRCISDLKELGRLPNPVKLSWYAKSGTHKEQRKTKVKKQRRPQKQGLEIDTIVRHIDGTKRYILTAIDIERRFAYARTYTSHSSNSARDFLKQLIHYTPFSIDEIQTDNGSEFAKYFHEACLTLNINHYHTYPRCPKMNAYIERFNRTVQEEHIIYHRSLLRDSIPDFNDSLNEWLYWYNHERPHEGLGLLSPMEYYREHYEIESQRW
ncbi:MAG: transposase [Candidatus Nomurabacteria bacterium]|nr:transposase [Candidatus Nomurabacteria bacterium]MCB9810844.1 transposase [Candidatus Nomurabacteria bacterium]MCB9810903.1 transposase [Candidatus Nomurabacteria bacterium]MCB9811025.1 transposase [Candidatus Nomurabacteria bacterium]MCB9811172.1 transposase [Candidatus Nomurabacteria bacterium]